MPATQASIGYGSSFAIGDTADPPAFTTLGEVKNITPPSASTDMIDASHMASPGGRREFVAGLIDSGEASFEINYVPGSATDEILNDLLDEDPADRARECRITYPNGATHQFTGILMGYEISVPTDDLMTATVNFKVSGEITRTDPT